MAPRTRRPKTTCERSRTFRARRKRYLAQLDADIARLREDIASLESARDAAQSRCRLHLSRFTPTNSLAKLILEYIRLLEHCIEHKWRAEACDVTSTTVNVRATAESVFVRSIMDKNVIIGEYSGHQAVLNQWRRYSRTLDQSQWEIASVTLSGAHDHPIVDVRGTIHGTISDDTFRILFPNARNDEYLKQRFLGRKVSNPYRLHYAFTLDNKVALEKGSIDWVKGLQDAGFALADIAELMRFFVVTSDGVIPDPEELPSRISEHCFLKDGLQTQYACPTYI